MAKRRRIGGFRKNRKSQPHSGSSGRRLNLEQLEQRLALTVVINEFLAENDTGIRDAAGHRHDWIELKNIGGSAENIAGWYLTDESLNLTKFQIPSAGALTTLDPGEILLIYASGNNGEVGLVGSELHTNFQLSQEPGYLGLVRSNGSTIEHEVNLYPQQTLDVSYGTGSTDSSTLTETLVGSSTGLKYLVPLGENATTDDFWREPGFSTASWGTGSGGIGKDVNSDSPNFNTEGWIDTNISGVMGNTQRTVYVRYEFDVSNPEQLTSLMMDLRMDDGFIVYLNGREMTRANFGEDFAQPQPMWNSDAGNLTTSSSANANHVGAEVSTPLHFDFTPWLQYLVDDGIADGNDNVLAFHGVNTASTNTASLQDFLIQPVLTAERATGSSQIGYMAATSPGRENGVSKLGYIEDTVFSHDRGFYDTAFSLEITTPSTAGTSIYYTTDGSIPTESSTLYTGPISIDPNNISNGERGVVMIRAKAFKTDFIPTNVDTQTYVFLDKVILQDGSDLVGTYETWGRDKTDADNVDGYNGDDESDWEMDPSIVSGNETAVKDALTSIPTMSLVMDWDDLFGGDPQPGTPVSTDSKVNPAPQGIYIVGSSSERQASLEFFNPDVASDQFQVDTLVEVQGHSSSLRWRSDKLSLQVKFKNPLADPELDYPLFDGSPYGQTATTQFDTLILDAGYNWWWHNNNAAQAADARFVPDQVTADLQNAASGVGGPHGKFVNLYINGLYWGVYYAHERPDDSFAAEYYGGSEDDYYVIKHASDDIDHEYTWADGGVSAELAYADLLNATRNVASNPGNMTLYENVEDILDVDEFIDYMIVHFYAGNETDWPHNNWYATFNHVDLGGKWRFHEWDQEHAFGTPSADPTDYGSEDFESPGEVFNNLINNDEFRLKFADRTQALLFDGGPLTEANAQATYEARVNEIFDALVAESARWGDNREKDSGTTFTQSDFNSDKNSLIASFFPTRSDLFAGDDLGPGNDNWNENGSFFENRGWLVNLEAPEFSLSGNLLTLTDPQSSGGTIWYTLDGSDPRDRNTNNQSGTAFQYTGPITLTGSAQVWARIDDGNSGTVDDWSALAVGTFFVESQNPAALRIVELHYNPDTGDAHEFIELLNTGATTISLDGVRIADFVGTPYQFENGQTLAPGARIVVARNPSDFTAQYGTVGIQLATGAGYADGNLSNGGETLSLYGPGDVLLQKFAYTDDPPWPTTPDGGGPSLVYVGPLAAGEDPNDGDPGDPFDVGSNWAASADLGGSPGAAEPSGGILYGDYNENDVVDAADYSTWRDALTAGATSLPNDITPGVVDESDFLYWRSHFGEVLSPGAGSGAATLAVAQEPAEEETAPAAAAVQVASEPSVPQPTEPAGLATSVALVLPSHADFSRHVATFVRHDGQRGDGMADSQAKLLLDSLRSRGKRFDAALDTAKSWQRWHHDEADEGVLADSGDTTADEPSCRVWEDAGWLQTLACRRLG